MKTCDLHLHSKDLFDSDNSAERVCKREKELGAKAVALTQHGVASQIESFKKAAKKYGLKFIPGIEAYYSTAGSMHHLIMLAMDDAGWKSMCIAISEGQNKNGQAVMTEELLRKHFGPERPGHGHVIATSACINGVIAAPLRANGAIEREIKKIEKRMEKATKGIPGEELLQSIEEDLYDLREEETEKAEEYTKTQLMASMKFKKREKAIEKMDGEQADKERRQLEADRKASQEAAEKLPSLKEELALIRKRISAVSKEKKEALAVIEKKQRYIQEIEELEQGIEDEEVLEENAEEEFSRFIDIFGNGNFYAEVQNHGIDDEAVIYPKIAKLARKLGIPIVATNDVHTVDNSEEELLRRQMLMSLRFEQWKERQAGDDQLYIKTDEEMREWLLRILPEDIVNEAMGNIMKVVDRCNVEFKVENHYPKYIPEDGRTPEEVLNDLTEKWLVKRFPYSIPEEYRKRMDRELETIRNMGFVSYHEVVWDFLDYACLLDFVPPEYLSQAPTDKEELRRWLKKMGFNKRVGVTTGPGRGSAAGSLVCNSLQITKLDPIKYNLLFERFLNPERVSMPDIDSDISKTARPKVIEYVKNKYGEDCVCGIMTQNAQAPRGAIRIAAKCYGLYLNRNDRKDNGAKRFLSLGDQIAKKVPMGPNISFDTKSGNTTVMQDLLNEYKENEDATNIVRWARVFEGCFTAYGAHAAGIVITDGTPVKEIVPLRWNDKLGIYTTQCDMVEVEENGMLKFDFLGLKTLDIINDCLWQLHREGISVRTEDIPLDDKKVLREIFAKGQTNSVFQFESQGMKQMLRRFRPETFEDLILLVAMFRPGPLQYLDDVIDVKNGDKPLEYLDERLQPILWNTYGAISFQEQVMRIFQDLAGYSLGQADLVRRAMSKKKMEVLEKERHAFVYGDPKRGIKGCVMNGIDSGVANKLFDQMIEFAKYAFNQSHAAVYADTAYDTGWLKYYYPAEFLMAAMRWAEKNQKKDPIPGLMAEAKAMGVEVRQPDINYSGSKFTVENGSIRFGLSAVRSVGASADLILQERKKNGPFRSFHDFFRRCPVKKDAIKNLIAAGAFDEFGSNRKAMELAVEDFKNAGDAVRKKLAFIETAKTMLPYVDEIETEEEMEKKMNALGIAGAGFKKVTTRSKLEKRIENAQNAVKKLNEEFNSLRLPAVQEDKEERMNRERELIGAYVTAHPLDEYSSEGEGIPTISEITPETKRIFGVIRSVQIKNRKKDGSPMAFIEVEDKTGVIRVNFFVKKYKEFSNLIEVGRVLVIDGNVKEEVVFTPNQEEGEENEEKEYVFIASKAREAKKKLEPYTLSVSSYAVFHVFEEAFFREKYEIENGHPFRIFDEALKEIREAPYLVSDEISNDERASAG